MELSAPQWIVLVFAAFVYGFTKTGILGFGIVLSPLLLYFFTPGQSLGMVLPLLIIADLIALVMLRKSVRWRYVFIAMPLALAGILVSWRFILYTQTLPEGEGDLVLRRFIAGMIVFVVVSGGLLRLARALRKTPGDGAAPTAGRLPLSHLLFAVFVALLGGAITMVANNSGPAWVVYLMLFRLDKFHFLGTAAWIICFINVTKLPFSIQLGYVTADTILLNLYLTPLVVAGVFFGRWVTSRLSQQSFDNIVQGLALLGALYLLFS